jgi:hypothetical protein
MSSHYWIVVASRDHVQRGVAGGFMQANHGKEAPLRRMHTGDWIVYYSPKVEMGGDERCQCFTAIGQLKDERIYPHDMDGGFVPFRRDVQFLPCREASILPLIEKLFFIQDKKHWGAPLRFGLLAIPAPDFRLIAESMLSAEQLTQV